MNLTILTGAGISAESGIPTFRDFKDGLWENFDVTKVATPEGFQEDPDMVNRFYNERREQLSDVVPNDAHYALVDLEEFWTENDIGGFLLITQNIDDLHYRAGSKNVCHMHGELTKSLCTGCQDIQKIGTKPILPEDKCIICGLPLRPDVVWFGEYPHHLGSIEQVIDRTNIYLAIGTSGSVMPASLFGDIVTANSLDTESIELTLEVTTTSGFDKRIEGKASQTVPELVEVLKESHAP